MRSSIMSCCWIAAALLILNGSAAFDFERDEIVLVHGASHGAWCWYKVQAILNKRGYKTTALDLTSNGRDRTDANSVTSVSQYAKPLMDHIANVSGKVVLVGHSLGGVSLSYAAETFPEKISKLIYVTAVAQLNNQSALNTLPAGTVELLQQNRVLEVHESETGPTSFRLNSDFQIASQTLYNESPIQDVFLATSLLSWTPFAALAEKLSLSPTRYGSVPRYFVIAAKDSLFDRVGYQEARVAAVSFNGVFVLPNADHSPFFSHPRKLSKIISKVAWRRR